MSWLGFAAVFVLVCGASSAVLAGLARGLAAADRRVALLALLLPVVLGGAMVTALALYSAVGSDHCTTHGDHAHLCVAHGTRWSEQPAIIALVALATSLVIVRATAMAVRWRRARVLTRLLRAIGSVRGGMCWVESERPLCFVGGVIRPTTFVSSAARAILADDEWAAMLAHERGHIAHRDLLKRLGVELLALFAAPIARTRILARWDDATERLRDADAADATSGHAVARALVKMARGVGRADRLAAFAAGGDRSLETRVTALLDGVPRGEPDARRIGRRAAALAFAGLIAIAVAVDPLHHALETLLG